MTKTDHSQEIDLLRRAANTPDAFEVDPPSVGARLLVASDLLEMHDRQSLSLDKWKAARTWIESLIGHPITENHA